MSFRILRKLVLLSLCLANFPVVDVAGASQISFPTDQLPKLSELVVTTAEAQAVTDTDLSVVFSQSNSPAVIDATPELAGSCALDCVKVIWYVPV